MLWWARARERAPLDEPALEFFASEPSRAICGCSSNRHEVLLFALPAKRDEAPERFRTKSSRNIAIVSGLEPNTTNAAPWSSLRRADGAGLLTFGSVSPRDHDSEGWHGRRQPRPARVLPARETAGRVARRAHYCSVPRTSSRSTCNSTFVISGRKKSAIVQSRTMRRRRSQRGI